MAVADNTRKLITSIGPAFPTRELTVGAPDAVQFTSMTDGTTTIVQIALYGEPIATGIAKRHPNDARNSELGMALAAARAFTDAATRYAATVDRMLNEPEPDPSARAVKQLRKLGKDDTRRRKDIRRKAARQAHWLEKGWDHTSFERAFGVGASSCDEGSCDC